MVASALLFYKQERYLFSLYLDVFIRSVCFTVACFEAAGINKNEGSYDDRTYK